MAPWLIVFFVAALALVAYWQLVLADGAYLGPRVVAFLYDIVAHRYNRIKRFNPEDDALFLARPIIECLAALPRPFVLDVATGSGRLPLALLSDPGFTGSIVAVDRARLMLREAAQALRGYFPRVLLSRQEGTRLAFGDDRFAAVACLEALEFMPDPQVGLAECVRVLEPGGILLVTRRTGPWARWMPGRTCSRDEFKARVQALGVWDVRIQAWTVDYDLVWGVKMAQWNEEERSSR